MKTLQMFLNCTLKISWQHILIAFFIREKKLYIFFTLQVMEMWRLYEGENAVKNYFISTICLYVKELACSYNIIILSTSPGFRYYLSGTDMTLTDYDGRTALHIAAAQGIKQLMNHLIFVINKTRLNLHSGL